LETIEPLYRTNYGAAFVGDSLELLDCLKPESVNLVVTSPPFVLQRQKAYGNLPETEYIEWLGEFAKKIKRVLTEDGSFVLDLGGAYQSGKPIRSLYNYRILIKFCDEIGYKLAEEFFWFNPAKLPSPIEWVNRRKIRVKDAVNTVWWFSKSDYPKADITKVLAPYSDRMKKLLKNPEKYYKPKLRPSGHDIGAHFGVDKGGAIPSNYVIDVSNALEIANSESSSKYLRNCKIAGAEPNPARFPKKLPDFFIKMLTGKDDVILDTFAGSNTAGEAAEDNQRKWISCEVERKYAAGSVLRFIDSENESKIKKIYEKLLEENTYNYSLITENTLPISQLNENNVE